MEKNYEALVNGEWIPVTSEDLLFKRVNFTAYREAFVKSDDPQKQTAMEWIRANQEVSK